MKIRTSSSILSSFTAASTVFPLDRLQVDIDCQLSILEIS